MKKEKIKRLMLEFKDLEHDEREDILLMLNAHKLQMAVHDIQQEVFRPARKHGYEDKEINLALDKCGVTKGKTEYEDYSNGSELISLLESKFIEVLRDNEVLDICE